MQQDRREFLQQTICAAAAIWMPSTAIGLGFSLYGMKSWRWNEALRELAEIGYDCVELPVMADWPWDSAGWTNTSRMEFKQGLKQHGLRLSAIMENLSLLPVIPPTASAEDSQRLQHTHRAANQKRLALAAELANYWSDVPLLETVLGGKPTDWPRDRQRLIDELGAWSQTLAQHHVVMAIKPHVSGLLHQPHEAAAVVAEVNSRWIRATFDYSHYQLRGLKFAECWKPLADISSFIHVKDAQGDASKFQFLLPGAGMIDYGEYLRAVVASGYRGDVVVEVSGQIHGRPDYDAKRAARDSYAALSTAFTAANITRHRQ
jgi:sugar phosphate isomerase/epimerase